MSREREVVLVLWESPANPAEALARGGERGCEFQKVAQGGQEFSGIRREWHLLHRSENEAE